MTQPSSRAEAGEKAPRTEDTAEEFARIGDMAGTFGVSLRTLRFYEAKGLLAPKREGNTRLYTRQDQARMKLIMMGRRIGFSLRDVKQMIDLYDPNGANTKQLRMALDKSEKQLARLHRQRKETEDAIEEAGTLIDTIRGRLSARTSS